MRYVLDRGVGDTVEDEDSPHDHGSEVLPTEVPEHVRSVARHLLHAVAEPLRSKHPANGHRLKERVRHNTQIVVMFSDS